LKQVSLELVEVFVIYFNSVVSPLSVCERWLLTRL